MSEFASQPRPTPTRVGQFSWMLFDFAAQPFHTLILTFIFAPYFAAHLSPNAVDGQAMWGYAIGLGGFVIAILAPVLGAMSDTTGPRKPYIAFFSIFAIIGASLMFFAAPGTENGVLFAVVGVFLAIIGFEFATIFNNAMMPNLIKDEDLGLLSGFGWALGYVGGILTLLIILAFMAASPETGTTLVGLSPIFGLDPMLHEGDRASGLLTAIWYLIFIIPLFLFTPDAPKIERTKNAIQKGLRKLGTTLKNLPQRKSYFAYLLASMFYRDGLNGLYAFGGIYAVGMLGLSTIQIGVFGIIAALSGAIGATIGAFADKNFGPKAVVSTCCYLLILACVIVVSTTQQYALFTIQLEPDSNIPLIIFYIAGAIIGGAGGALQAASRTLLVRQVPQSEVGEAFGLFALTGRATSFIAPLSIAVVTSWSQSQQIGITPIIALFVLGAVGLLFVTKK
ncbi:MFS transporter [Maritalea mediterranea]|uniref:MFS transporter n=1 Tax=Maritalea mediterranea TaxID=2909667 RepID=A0ABS9EAS2_9HYPH|nr:MFS transporter [Maritalea mediterranea]MCF4099986.1 MFS transporter [Maritalea mediterranea]